MKKSNFCEQDDEGSDGGDVETLVFGDIESTFWTRKTTASRKYTEENPLLLPFVSISWLEVSLLLHRNTDGNINTRCSVVSKFTWRHSSTFVSFSSSSFASFSFSCVWVWKLNKITRSEDTFCRLESFRCARRSCARICVLARKFVDVGHDDDVMWTNTKQERCEESDVSRESDVRWFKWLRYNDFVHLQNQKDIYKMNVNDGG